jgi:hypothetical protein
MNVDTLGVACLLTRHASRRMRQRGLSDVAVQAALNYGREVYTKGAFKYAIGHKEVDFYRGQGVELSAYAGVQVVCTPWGDVVTAYRNSDFRGLRSGFNVHRRRRKVARLHRVA